MNLSNRQRRFLMGRAHRLEPVVTIGGRGLTESVIKEFDNALAHHELMKVKLPAGRKSDRIQLAESLCATCGATLVALIGRVGVVYRPGEKPSILLPD